MPRATMCVLLPALAALVLVSVPARAEAPGDVHVIHAPQAPDGLAPATASVQTKPGAPRPSVP